MFGLSFILSILALALGSAFIHFYLWRRIVRDNEWEHGIASGLTLTLTIMAVIVPLVRLLSRLISNDILGVVQGLTMTWMLFAFYVAVLIALWDFGRWVYRNYRAKFRPTFNDNVSRAKYALLFQEHNTLATGPGRFWNRLGTVIIIFLGLLITLKGFFGAFHPPQVVESGMTAPTISADLNGFRILQLSDLHLSVFFNDAKFDALVDQVEDLHPDLIVITGDIADASNKKLKHGFDRLNELTAPFGVFAVLGNHEAYLGPERVAEALGSMGVIVLRNSALPIHIGKQTLCIAGVDDQSYTHLCKNCGPHIDEALMACPVTATRVLLTHQPQTYVDWSTDENRTEANPVLVFAGHTHGGQVWPFQWLTEFMQTYVSGTYTDGDTTITVSNGVGISAPLARMGATPGMTLFTMHAPPSAATPATAPAAAADASSETKNL